MRRKLEEDVITKEQLEDVTGEREFDEDDFISQEELNDEEEVSGIRYPVYSDRDE